MRPEDHIHFLSELLYAIDQLQALVREYCQEMTEGEEQLVWNNDNNDSEKMPF